MSIKFMEDVEVTYWKNFISLRIEVISEISPQIYVY